MDADDLRKAIRRSWWLILSIVAISAAAAVTYTLRTEPRYESQTQLFVAGAERESSAQSAPSYAALVTSPNVTAPVVRTLALRDTPSELAKRLSGTAAPDTVLIDLTVADSDPRRAQRIGQAVAERLIRLVEQLERPERSRAQPVRLIVSSPASLPSGRVSPNAVVNVVAGVGLGLVLGMLGAILRRRLDRRISIPADLSDRPGPGVLATVPIDDKAATGPADGPRAVVGPERAEAMRRLRTNLRFLETDKPPRTIAVTSSVPGEGASTTAVGLAMAMAEAGADVVLVEADLRRPGLADHLGLRRDDGVAEHLATGKRVEQLLQPCSVGDTGGSLRVLVAGAVPPNPSGLLSSQRLPNLLEELCSSCDLVLVDTPPLLAASDGAVLAGEADAVLLVVRMGAVTVPELERALDILAGVRASVLGFVANGVASTARDKDRAYPTTPEPTMAPPPPAEPVAPAPPAAPTRRQRTGARWRDRRKDRAARQPPSAARDSS